MKNLRTPVLLLCLALAGALAPVGSAQAAVPPTGSYIPLSPSRILDTRNGTGAPQQQLGPGQTLQLTVAGRGGVPSTGAAAAVLNITAVSATASSFLSVYPAGQARPTASSINFVPGKTRANIATARLGTAGAVTIYNSSGSVSVVVDVVGYYATSTGPTTGNEFTDVVPERLSDTRPSSAGPLASQESLVLYVDFGLSGDLNSAVNALALNVTAVGAEGSGFLQTYDGGTVPGGSTLNYSGPASTSNMSVVRTSDCPTSECPSTGDPQPVRFGVFNGSATSVDVIVDLVGVYYNDGSTGLRFVPLTKPVRIKDSRNPSTPLTAKQTQTLTAPTTIANADTAVLVTNVTAVKPTATTFLTLWANDGSARPTTSNLNAAAGTTVANGAMVDLTSRMFRVFNAAGTTNYLVDVTGRFDVGTGAMAQAKAQSTTDRAVTRTEIARRTLSNR